MNIVSKPINTLRCAKYNPRMLTGKLFSFICTILRTLLKCLGIDASHYRVLRIIKDSLFNAFHPVHKSIIDKYVKDDMLVVEVGAHHGSYIDQYLKHRSAVVAFEPSPESFSILENRYKKGAVELYNCALGRKRQDVSFYEAEKSVSSQSTCLEDVANSDSKKIKVSMRTLDEFCFKPGFIKIDAQGLDLDILIGAEDTLRKYRPLVLAEYYRDGLMANGQNPVDMLIFMDKIGYDFQTIQTRNEVTDILFIPRH